VFVPKPPPRRLNRATALSSFLSLESRRKETAASKPLDAFVTGLATSAGIAATPAVASPLHGSDLLAMAMTPPPVAPPLAHTAAEPPQRAAGAAAATARGPPGSGSPPEWGFLDLMFPGFDTDTFIWRVSVLQVSEFIGSLLLGSSMGTPKLCSLYLLGASWGPTIASGSFWRLFLPMTLHANTLHIFFNIFFQLRIGFGMEKQFGRRRFCLLYLLCGFLGNLLSVAADPMKLAVGASTSGFGLIGVWAAEVLLTWDLLGASRPRVFLWFAFMLLNCVLMSTLSSNVDFMGHFGGAVAGFLIAIVLADMQEEHRPEWYGKAKTSAKAATALVTLCGLLKVMTLTPGEPIPYCGTIFSPRQLPF